jgi:hypothetical protein
VSSLIGKKDVIVVVGQDFMYEVEFSKMLSCSYESLFIAPPIIHIHPKELV